MTIPPAICPTCGHGDCSFIRRPGVMARITATLRSPEASAVSTR